MNELLAGPLGLYQRIIDKKYGACDSFISFSIYNKINDYIVIKKSQKNKEKEEKEEYEFKNLSEAIQ